MRVGVLALQGGFARHMEALERAGEKPVEARRSTALDRLDALVLPGGESTTLLNLMRDEPWFDALRAFHERGGALFGTCAGAILLSKTVLGPPQPSIGLLDAVVERNAWGRQIASFEADLDVAGLDRRVPAMFIRAPRVRSLGADVVVLATHRGEPVLVRQDRILAATFHPELTGDDRLHRLFLDVAREGRATRGSAAAAAAP